MASYRLTNEAEADLIRIHQWGTRTYGEAQADSYYHALFQRFERIAEQPLLYPIADHIRQGYRRSVCGSDTIYYRIDGKNNVVIVAIIGKQDVENWV